MCGRCTQTSPEPRWLSPIALRDACHPNHPGCTCGIAGNVAVTVLQKSTIALCDHHSLKSYMQRSLTFPEATRPHKMRTIWFDGQDSSISIGHSDVVHVDLDMAV